MPRVSSPAYRMIGIESENVPRLFDLDEALLERERRYRQLGRSLDLISLTEFLHEISTILCGESGEGHVTICCQMLPKGGLQMLDDLRKP